MLTTDPDFMDIDGLDNNPSTVLDNDYRLRVTSNAKDSGSNTNVPADELDVNDNMNSTEKLPWDLDKKNRFLPSPSGVVDRGVFEFSCYGDCVTSATLAPPPDGNVDAADLAYLLGAWGPNPGHCSDIVTSATFAPPPDGTVDSADLSMLLSWWGTPCENPAQGGEGLMGGEDSGPFDGTYFGMLLEELLATNDADLAEMIAELLSETLSE